MEVPPGMEDTAGISGHAPQQAIYAVCVIFTLLMGLMVIARMCTRMFIAKQTGLDDGFIVLAAIFSLMYCISTYNQAEQGMGLHVWDPAIDKVAMSVFFWCALWSYYAALGFTKLSILLQYLRIFPQENFRKACFGMIGVTVLWTLWAVFSSMIMCVPVHAFWSTTDFFHDPRCLPRMETWYANSAINFVTDLIVTLLPIGVIRSLEVPERQKNLLYLVFCIGLVTCLIGALRCIFIYPIMTNMDQTWHSPMFSIWSAVEVNVAILCSCAPTLKGLVQRVWPQFLASLGSKYGSRGSRGKSGREDSDATAVNTNNSTSSGDDNSLHKSKDICEVESQSPKKPSPTLLGFRRSLFKPFSSITHGSLASCHGGSKSDDEDVLFDDMARAASRKGSSTPTKAHHEEHGIEVQTSVDQFVMVKFQPKPEPEAHKTVVGSGPHARDPFDDDQEERDIQRAAWSSS